MTTNNELPALAPAPMPAGSSSSTPVNTGDENRKARRHQISFFWPIVLIAIGVVILLSNIGTLPGDTWDWVLRLWPIILIAWGLDGLLRRELVGPAFLIGLGAIFLLANFGWLTLSAWDVVLRLWPVLLIVGGLSLIFDRQHWAVSIVGAVLVLGVLAASIWFVGVRFDANVAALPPGESITQEVGGATNAYIELEPTAGNLFVKAMSEPSGLLAGTVGAAGSGSLARSFSVDNGTANFRLHDQSVAVVTGPDQQNRRVWDLKLNPEILMALKVSQAAGDQDINLVGLKMTDLKVNNAVGTVKVTLPAEGKFAARVEMAVGDLTVMVPAGMGVRIHMGTALSATQVPSDYEHQGSTYTSPDYNTATNRVDLDINQAIGRVVVRTLTTGR